MMFKILFAIVVIALLAGGVYYFRDSLHVGLSGNSVSETTDDIVAYVNGLSIAESEVNSAAEYIRANSGMSLNSSQVLDSVIAEKLLLQEAEKEGLTFDSVETEQEISRILNLQNKTLQEFQDSLESKGKDYFVELESYRKQFLIQKLLSSKITKIQITDEEARAYYDANKNSMFTGEVAVSYESIAPQLKEALAQQQENQQISLYLAAIQKNANITYLS